MLHKNKITFSGCKDHCIVLHIIQDFFMIHFSMSHQRSWQSGCVLVLQFLAIEALINGAMNTTESKKRGEALHCE